MFGKSNDDGEQLPQLKFKVPNFIGTLTERKRPVFADATSSEEQTPVSERHAQCREPPRSNTSFNEAEQIQQKPSAQAPIKPMDLFMQARTSNALPQIMKPSTEKYALQKIDEEVSLKRMPTPPQFTPQPRFTEPEPVQHQRASTKSINDNYNHYERREAHPASNEYQSQSRDNPFDEEVSRVDHRSSSYSHEADQYLNQIVTILAHFRSLGKRSADSVTQLEAQLSIERDNCNQQKSLLDLERQAKAMVQEELQSTRDMISQLTDKLNKVHQEKLQLERSRIEEENERWQLKKELDSVNIEKELSKNELEHLHANLQDLERSLFSISEERTLLNTELSMQRSSMIEQEQNLRAEIDKGTKSYIELQADFECYKENINTQIKALEAEKSTLESEKSSLLTFVKDARHVLELEPDASMDSVLESIKTLTRQKTESDSASSHLIEELKTSLEQKQKAMDHLQGRLQEFGLKMQQSDRSHADTVAGLEIRNRELQAAYDAVMNEAKSLRGVNAKVEEYEKFFAAIKTQLPNSSEVNSFDKVLEVIENWKIASDKTVDEKVVEELRSNVKKQQEAYSAEKNNWEAERHRLVAERLKLIQENETLKRSKSDPKTPVQKISPSGETTTESIMRAIEADLKKAKGSQGPVKQAIPDDSWTVSDGTTRSPLKRVTASRSSLKKKKTSMGSSSLARESPLKGQSGNSELDFWAFAK